ncbi:tRNA dimethylallyltransferase [Kribbella aluminosa]|uniref:tRNA dimethylallyltransferase n=1 Tax=Kribbella aluminosa TaxID=416017 RepID=A0ABS4UDU6_9ACTN|nr:isopentenyl transferase family protein [Kribbella aluminosa]MBP2349806.1 tRNA dimethylallyltransferase [Kribbella aluminosa]
MSDAAPRLLVALYGPTSAGKTAVSVDLCLRIRDELGLPPMVVSADSRQVYRYMDIGTSKTTPEEMRGIPHTMIDVTEPVRKLELETFVAEARRHMEDCWTSGGVPVIVGGTSVYVRSLLEGWEVDAVAEARNAIRRDFPRSMAEDAYAVLARLDPQAAGKIHENNYDAIVNALARAMGNDPERAVAPATRQVVFAVDRSATDIDQRVAATYDHQVARGPARRGARPGGAVRRTCAVPPARPEVPEPGRPHARVHRVVRRGPGPRQVRPEPRRVRSRRGPHPRRRPHPDPHPPPTRRHRKTRRRPPHPQRRRRFRRRQENLGSPRITP